MKRFLASLFFHLVVLFVGCGCSRTDLDIAAEKYSPVVGPVIPPIGPGAPDGLVWISEPSIGKANPDLWTVSPAGMLASITPDNPQSAVFVGLSPEDGEHLRCVRASVAGAAGHEKLPQSLPTLSVWRVDLDDGGVHLLTSSIDKSPDAAAYEKTHQVEACVPAVTAEIVDLSRFRYHATVLNEGGLDALAGLTLIGVRRGVVLSP